MDDKRALFSAVFGNNNQQTTTKRSETTMAKSMTASLPIDDPELSNVEAIAAQLRADHEDMQLLKARLDGMTEGIAALHPQLHGITEALAAIASDVKALAAAPAHTAAPAATTGGFKPFGSGGTGGGSAPAGGKRVTWGLVALGEKTLPKKSGGTFTKVVAQFSNGYERDVPKQFVGYFSERQGQEVSFTEAKNQRGYNEIVSVG